MVRWALAAAVVGGCVYLLARQGDDVATAVRRLSVGRVALAGVLGVAATMCLARMWLALLTGLGVEVGRRDAAAVFYLSQLGKYVPGSVWPVLAQVHLGARWGAPRRLMLGAGLLLLVVVTASGISVGAVLLPWASPDGLRRYWWLLVLVVPLAVLLHPRALMAVLDRLSVWSGGQSLEARVSGRGVGLAWLWAILGWVLLGGQLAVLMSAYGPLGVTDVAAAIGGIGLAWAAGLAFVPAPAGVGVREGVLLLALGPTAGVDAALAVAVASRVLLVVADVVLAATGVARHGLRDLRAS
ncbi:lysylphosphatidylglycerol synthase domain-containing protein [Nocardioides renjunii]|uniref:lysylphosphatidylglycerol synthase domain-containing protein n=1 Tax=Nocardioides renjunii TaxID=3095075 RepID=UPI002AFEEFAC|nr:lysylphosphatidylglycerol synthase domain-containing protein [Nocardioides sp. S-34]WQQ24143.1 lysylphosphatidylglycerol synthase domain-containing protein [Nocardioides sp. S-34]